ncbi:MAG TPA: SusC/RagA family TonB-linked outer membrane protein, partial [Sphingobacterium sp.]|nr:SusC/RagA family TonB-linked outer membrane protein [Sphingobacterium sp.]
RANFRANIDLNLTSNTVVSLNLGNLYEKGITPGAGESSIWSSTFSASPNAYPVRFPDGKFSGPEIGSNVYNPYNLLTQSGYSENFWNYSQAQANLVHKFDRALEGLSFTTRFSWDAFNSPRITRTKQVQTHAATGIDEFGEIIYIETHPGEESLGYTRSMLGNRQTYLETSLTYEKILAEQHRVGGLLLFNQNSYNDVASSTAIGSLPYRRQGLASRLTYSFDDRYFVEGNFGYNGSENFAPGNRFGFFPAAAVGWLVSNERFWQPISDVVNNLKFRASYGLVGNDQIGGGRRFIYEATVLQSGVPGYIFGETMNYNPGAIRMGEIANPNVSWEKSYKTNVGAEFSLFNRLDIQADYFHDRREGIFIQRSSLPGMAGLSTLPWVNIGQMKNQGFDGQLEFKSQWNEVFVSALGNFTYTHNTILYNDQPDWKNLYQNRVGKPFGQVFALHALGLFQSEDEINNSPRQDFGPVRIGDIKYADINGDGIVDGEDQIAIGYPSIPEIVYGFGLNFRWKALDASVFFQGIANTSLMVSGSSFFPFSSGNLLTASVNQNVYDNRWHEGNPDPNAKYPRLDNNQNINNNRNSSLFQHDASFIRLKNMDLGYTIPKRWIDSAKLKNARIYVSGSNLLTFSKFKLWDPERGGGQGAGYPPTRILLLGATIDL